jgi:hypothetical protein
MAFAEDIHKHKHSKLQNVGPDDHHRKWGLFDEPSWIRTLFLPLGTFTKVGVILLGVGGWHNSFVSHPRPIYNGAEKEYWVYFAGGTNWRAIGLATGTSLKAALTEITDGINGSSRVLQAGVGFEQTGVSFPSVIYDPLDVATKRWKMMYNGRNATGTYEKIGYAYSADGKNWTKEATNPVFEIADRRVDSPALFRLGNKFYMLYRQTLVDPMQIGLAYSDDCITWTQYSGNPVLSLGSAGEWDDNFVGYITLYFDQGTFYMLYSGKQAAGLYKMGLALSTNCLSWTKLPYNPVLEDTIDVSTGCLIRMEDEFILAYEHGNPKSIRSATIP